MDSEKKVQQEVETTRAEVVSVGKRKRISQCQLCMVCKVLSSLYQTCHSRLADVTHIVVRQTSGGGAGANKLKPCTDELPVLDALAT